MKKRALRLPAVALLLLAPLWSSCAATSHPGGNPALPSLRVLALHEPGSGRLTPMERVGYDPDEALVGQPRFPAVPDLPQVLSR